MIKTFIKIIAGFLENLAQESINFVLTILSWFGKLGEVVLDMPVVETGIIYTQVVALSVLGLKISYEAYMIYILRMQGEPSSDPMGLLIGAVRAISVVAVMPWLIRYLYGWGLTMTSEVANLPNLGYSEPNNSTFSMLFNLISTAGAALMLISVAVLFSVIMLIIIVVQNFIRAVEIVVAAWTGSFMAMGLTNRESQLWTNWWQDTLILCLSSVIQMALMRFSFFALTPIKADVGGQMLELPAVVNLFLFIAALWVTYKSPHMLKEKLHATGIGRAGGTAIQSVSQSVLMKRIMK